MAMPEITIYGAGIFGLSIAWVLRQRGAKVQIIDPNGPASGASGGTVGALAPHVPDTWNDKKQFQFESLVMAQGFWDEISKNSNMPTGYGQTGRLQPLADEAAIEFANERAINARDLWHGKASWRVIGQSELGEITWAPPSPTGLYVFDTLSARIDPRRACASLCTALKNSGVNVIEKGEPKGRIIHARGWQDLMEITQTRPRVFGNGVKGQSALLKFEVRANAPQLFAHGIHVVPHDNGTVAIGSTSERYFQNADQTDEMLDDVIKKAKQFFPILSDAPVIDRWANVRPRARTRSPIIGMHPLYEGEYIANGGFKIGFGMAPKLANIMADLVLDNSAEIPPGFLPEANF